MKKLVLLLAVVFSVSLCSCGNEEKAEAVDTTAVDTTAVEAVDSAAADTAAADTVAPAAAEEAK